MRAFHNLVDVLLMVELHVMGQMPQHLAEATPAYVESLQRLQGKGIVNRIPDEHGVPRLAPAGANLLLRLRALTVATPPRPEDGKQHLFDNWLKYAQNLEGLLCAGHEQVEELEAILADPGRTPFKEEETEIRLFNDRRLRQILWDLYCHNSEAGTNNEQDLRLLELGFKLFNQPHEGEKIPLNDPHKLGSRLSKILRLVTHSTGYRDNPLLMAIKEACWGR